MNWAVPTEKKSNNGHLLVFKFEDFSQLLMDLRLQDPTLKIKVTEQGGGKWTTRSQGSGGLSGARVKSARAC